VPFDIKLGNVLYEGQGNDSQIYVTSKAFMSFGQGDHTYGGWPNTQGIYVYQSDWMTTGTGAYIDVTTTDTTLKIEWSLVRFGDSNGPLTNVIWNMTVNPTTGEWTGYSTISGNTSNLYGGPRIGVRETSGGTINDMTPVPSDPTLIQKIEDQTIIVNGLKTTLQTLTSTRNTIVLVVQNKQIVYDSSLANATSTSVVRNKAVTDLASAINSAEDLTEAVVISVQDAETQVSTTYVVVSATKIAQTPVIIEPAPRPSEEPVVSEPEPTIPPTEEPAPTPETPEEPVEEPTENVVDETPEPEPTETPEPTEPELPVTEEEAVAELEALAEIAPEDLTDAQVEQLVEAAMVVFETAEQGSPEYEQALEALATAAEADDPEIYSELAAIPLLGDVAGAALEVLNDLGNVGADMSPEVREEAEQTVIASVIAVGAAVSAVSATTTAAAASAGASASSSSTRRGK
jgi:hypothetical protein